MRKALGYKKIKKYRKNKQNNMENTKASVWPNRALEVNVEYELRTSAPQEEMERYYRGRRWEIAPKFNKNEMEKILPSKAKNFKKYEISEKYCVLFYTTPHYAVFRYYEGDGGTEVVEMNRSCMVWWLSSEEEEKLFNFEDKKKEKYKKYEVCGIL